MAEPFDSQVDPFGDPALVSALQSTPSDVQPLAPPVLPQAPVHAPPVQLPTLIGNPAQTDPRQQLMAIAALGALIGAGPRSGIGAGIGMGTLQAQDHLRQIAQARENQRFQLQQQADAQLAAQQKQAAVEQQQRERNLFAAIEKIKADAKGATDPESYQQTIEGGSLALLQAGYRIPPTRLMQMVPYVPPAHEKKYVDAWELWNKNEVNRTLLAQNPEKAILGTITVNVGTRANPDLRPLPVGQVAQLAGQGFTKDPTTGQLIVAAKEASGTSAFDLKLKSLTDVFRATHRREPTAAEKDALVDKAILASKEKPEQPNGPMGGLTEDGLDYAATQFRLLGRMPPQGRSNAQAYAAIQNRAAEQAKALGQSPAVAIQKQLALKADASALTRLRTMSSSAAAFENKAKAQTDIIAELSAKVPRTQWPVFNDALLAGRARIAGDSNTQQLFNAITTFTSEYAKIMEGSTGSAAGSSDSARKAGERLISAGFNQKTLMDTLNLMKREMRLTIDGYDASIADVTERMGGNVPPPKEPPPGNVSDDALSQAAEILRNRRGR